MQFSEDNIRDATGVWLLTYAVQGIQYILSFAKPYVTRRVIINLSYGPTTGPHDGMAELEMALSALVADYDGTSGKPKLDIVLAAGNSYLTEGHVVFRRHHNQPDHVEWTWRLPPDNTVLCFCRGVDENSPCRQCQCDPHIAKRSYLQSTTIPPSTAQSLAGVDGPIAWGSDDTMWRFK